MNTFISMGRRSISTIIRTMCFINIKFRFFQIIFPMRRIAIWLLICFFTSNIQAQPLPVKLKHSVIIDTDCGIDDMRAISYLLARPEITIKGILLSDGSLSPAEGAGKVGSLLHEFSTE